MTKAVLISIRPKWVEKILTGEKTLEVRRNRPNMEPPFKCFIYCTNNGGCLANRDACLNGKVAAEFVCDTFLPIQFECNDPAALGAGIEVPGTCLTDRKILEYLGNGKRGFAWHISNLKIYDTPKSLSKFRRICDKGCRCEGCARYWGNGGNCGIDSLRIKRPPQSWCYVEELK